MHRDRPPEERHVQIISSKSLAPTEQAWSAFERELFGIREALANKNRRANKKLLRWAIDIEEGGVPSEGHVSKERTMFWPIL